jgi:hypothetical protein
VITAYASTNSDPKNNPSVDGTVAQADLATTKTLQLYAAGEDSEDANATLVPSWHLIKPSGSLASIDASNVLQSIDTWGNYLCFLIMIKTVGGQTTYSERDPLLAPASAFVTIRVPSTGFSLQKPAKGSREWQTRAYEWVTALEGMSGHNSRITTLENAGADALNDLSDVTISGPADKEVVLYNNTAGKFENRALRLDEHLEDVEITGVANDNTKEYVLRYDPSTDKWVRDSLNLNSLEDFSGLSPTDGDFLKYVSGAWTLTQAPVATSKRSYTAYTEDSLESSKNGIGAANSSNGHSICVLWFKNRSDTELYIERVNVTLSNSGVKDSSNGTYTFSLLLFNGNNTHSSWYAFSNNETNLATYGTQTHALSGYTSVGDNKPGFVEQSWTSGYPEVEKNGIFGIRVDTAPDTGNSGVLGKGLSVIIDGFSN